MPHIQAERVRETSVSTGTGAFTLAGAVPGFQTFAAGGCANLDTVHYCITSRATNEWETGVGTWGTGGVLTRTTVVDGSSGKGVAVNFSAGTKDVFLTTLADRLIASSVNGGHLGGLRNKLINAAGLINQRAYAAGAATGAALRYTVDRWRVVVSGENLNWSDSNGIRTFTAPAGGVEQVIEAVDLPPGTYTLSWTGTATATVNGGAVANGGQVALAGNATATVRFSAGTFSLPQFEVGGRASSFERRMQAIEIILCHRFYCGTFGSVRGPATGSGQTFESAVFWPVLMRANPTVALPGGVIRANVASVNTFNSSQSGCRLSITSTAAGDTYAVHEPVTADAEL